MWYSWPKDKQSCWNLICNGDCLPVSVFHSIQHVLPSGFMKHMSATPGTTPMALFMAPLMPFTLVLLMANTLPRNSGREFHRFVNALAWALISLISTSVECDVAIYGIECTVLWYFFHRSCHHQQSLWCVRIPMFDHQANCAYQFRKSSIGLYCFFLRIPCSLFEMQVFWFHFHQLAPSWTFCNLDKFHLPELINLDLLSDFQAVADCYNRRIYKFLVSWTGHLTTLNMSIVWEKIVCIAMVAWLCGEVDSLSKKRPSIYTICVCVCVCVHVCVYTVI